MTSRTSDREGDGRQRQIGDAPGLRNAGTPPGASRDSRNDSSSETSEGTVPADTLISGLWLPEV